MKAALVLQVALMSRALTTRVATALMVLAPAAFSLGFVALARNGSIAGPGAQSFAPYAEGEFATAASMLAGQMICIWTLLAAGFAVSWSVGREWSDATYGSLFALPVPRSQIAWAKVVVASAWGVAAVTLATALVAGGILAVDSAHVDGDVWAQWGRVWVAGALMVVLALPFGAVAAWFKGYLGAAAAIIAATAVSQVLGSVGLGAWTPYVAPAIWAGAAGADAAEGIGLASLLGALAFGVAGAIALVWRFGTARLD